MKIINASYEIMSDEFSPFCHPNVALKKIERIARVCYKSEDKITENADSANKLIDILISNGHEAMIEHLNMTVRFIVDRGVSHELVRHRMASFAQESTRYCNYSKDKFDNELTFIKPFIFGEVHKNSIVNKHYNNWLKAMIIAEETYLEMIADGLSPEWARSILPNSLKTELVMTANFREWRHIFKLRTSGAAHAQMKEVMIPLFNEVVKRYPVIFNLH